VTDGLTPLPRPMPRLLVVVVPSFALAALAIAADVPVAVRAPLVLWAVLGVPALVLASRLEARAAVERWVLGGAGALGLTIVASQALLYAGAWSPTLLLVVMGLLSVAGAGGRRVPAA
jgi:hypothetical protein